MNEQKKTIFRVLSSVVVILSLIGIVTGKHFKINIIPEKVPDSESSETSRERAIFYDDEEDIKLRGTIFDLKGRKLSYTEYQSEPQKIKRHFCDDPVSFSKYAPVLSNLIDTYSPSKEGLDILYNSILRKQNITPTTDYAIGQSVQLTIDAELSLSIYKLLYQLQNSEIFSSVIIMRPNGELLTMLSNPTFNLESYRCNIEYRTAYTGSPALVNSNRHTEIMDPSVFLKICKVYFNSNTISETGYNKLSKLINDDFGFSLELADKDTFGMIDKNSIEVIDRNSIKLSVTPIYLAEMMSLCTTGSMYPAKLMKNIVDTNDYKNIIEVNKSTDCILFLPDDKLQMLRQEYSNICSEYSFHIKKGYDLYGDYACIEGVEYLLGSYINTDSSNDSFIIVLKVDNRKINAVNNRHDMLEIYDNIIKILNNYK
ncbi:MAG: hypothetical protein IIT39_00245 [Clostridia bacterium]|nr:hypothetical protein [Clostridia bacterium]